MEKSKPEILSTTTGIILEIGGLLTAVGTLTNTLQNIHEKFAQTPPLLLWLVIVTALFIGARLMWRGLSRKSRLLRPEVLLIDPDNVRHLKGREDDLRQLSNDVANHPVVFLEGESGAGKSALVRSGLLPALANEKEASALLPVYVSNYGADWQSGPEVQVVRALWYALTPEQREQLGLNNQDEMRTHLWGALDDNDQKRGGERERTAQRPSLLVRVQNAFSKTLLVIFDQFDDYQALHRQRFLRNGKWTTAGQLAARNHFWAGIRDALQHDAIHCLFVTRSDTYGGLEAVRFREPRAYYLERLEPAYIIALLEEMVTPQHDERPVIAHPEAGWEALKDRMTHDLAYQGRILPIQARIALKGLIRLPYLSTEMYERAGRVEGLEAAYIEAGVASAAERGGLTRSQVLQILLHLVVTDQSNPEVSKTRACRQSDLVHQLHIPEDQLRRTLEVLEQNGIVRSRLNIDVKGDSADKQ